MVALRSFASTVYEDYWRTNGVTLPSFGSVQQEALVRFGESIQNALAARHKAVQEEEEEARTRVAPVSIASLERSWSDLGDFRE